MLSFSVKSLIAKRKRSAYALLDMNTNSRADQLFDPTLAFTGFSEDLLLSYAMITRFS